MADYSNMSLEELHEEVHRLSEAREALKEQAKAVWREIDSRSSTDKILKIAKELTPEERERLAKAIVVSNVGNIASRSKVATPGT